MLHTRVEAGVIPVVYLSGEIDLDSAETFRWVVGESLKGVDEAIIDLAGVKFIDSSGTGLLVRLTLDFRAQGNELRIRHVPPPVAEVFAMMKVRQLIGDQAFIDDVG
jgi:anti-anti-sigma factor